MDIKGRIDRYNTERKENELAEEKVKKSIERLERKLSRIQSKRPHWTDILEDLGKALAERFELNYEILGPFGMSAETAIHLQNTPDGQRTNFDTDLVVGITFESWNLEGERQLTYHANERLNGHDNIPLPNDFEEIVAIVKEREKKAILDLTARQ